MRSRVTAGAAPGWLERNGAICTRAPSHVVFHETELGFDSRIVPVPSDGAFVELSPLRRSFEAHTCRISAHKRTFPMSLSAVPFCCHFIKPEMSPRTCLPARYRRWRHPFTSLREEVANAGNSLRSRRYLVLHLSPRAGWIISVMI